MHENREISSTPWSDDQGRSAKATNRTADMHVPEKSDCAVVPVNQPNKEGQPSAEAGEGRAQTRENIVQSHMHPTQSGKRMSQGLDGVRKAAKCPGLRPWAEPVSSPRSLPRPPFVSHIFSIAGSNTGAEREVSQGRILCAA